MKILIASDHAGQKLKEELINSSINVNLVSTSMQNNETDDYPDFAFELCNEVLKENTLGVLICGNGIGISIAANKVKGIRCARVLNVDDAFKSRNHNGCNVVALSSKTPHLEALDIIKTFITTNYPEEDRHLRRVNKIINYEDSK